VSGAWYHEHADLTFYVKGHVRVHQEKSFSPTAVLPANPADQSVATLTLVNGQVSNFYTGTTVYYDGVYYDLSSCPDLGPIPICEFFQAANPIPILGGIIYQLGGVIQSVSNFFGGLQVAAASDPYAADAASLSETVMLAMEATGNPTWINVAAAIYAADQGGWTGGLIDAVVEDIVGALLGDLWFMT
jgi:hypothetical protein